MLASLQVEKSREVATLRGQLNALTKVEVSKREASCSTVLHFRKIGSYGKSDGVTVVTSFSCIILTVVTLYSRTMVYSNSCNPFS